MGTLLASSLIARCNETAQDEGGVIWESDQALEWLNDGQRAIVSLRPDASILNHAVILQAGTKQSITGLRFMAAMRNMGGDGLTPGRAIRLVDRGVKDDADPDWHTATPSSEIREYIYDARTPKEYYVSPPVVSSPDVYIEISEAVDPADVTAIGNPITLDNIYSPHLIEWMLYRFLSRDSEETPNIQRAISHFQGFFNLLGEKIQVDMAINPQVRAHLE